MNEETDVGDYIISISTIRNSDINRITHVMMRYTLGRPVFVLYKRLFDIIAFNKNTLTIDGACIIYKAKRFMVGLCTGKPEAITIIINKVKPRSVLVPKHIELDINGKREETTYFGSLKKYIITY